MVGQEIELNLVDASGMPSMRNAEALEAIADPAWATEVGQFNLEINVPPRQLDGDAFDGLEREVRADLNAADGKARTVGSHLVMIGILPTLDEHDVNESAMSANERYRVLNEQIFAARGEDMRIAIDGARAAAHPRRLDHARGGLHQRAAAHPGQPGRVRQLLERGPGHRGRAGRAGGQLAVPVRQAAVARDPDHAVRAGHRHPPGRAEGAGRAAPGVVRRALDHLGVRPVRGEPAVLPGAAADLRGGGPARRAGRRGQPSAGRDEPAQRDRLPLEPAGLRRGRRHAAPAGGEPGAAGRPDHRRRHGQRGVLLRPGPLPGRSPAADLDPDVVRHRRGEPARGRAPRPGRPAVLARRGRHPGRRAHPAPPAAAGPRGAQPLGREPGPRRPAARHRRAALPDRPDRRRLADRHRGRAVPARTGWTAGRRCAR